MPGDPRGRLPGPVCPPQTPRRNESLGMGVSPVQLSPQSSRGLANQADHPQEQGRGHLWASPTTNCQTGARVPGPTKAREGPSTHARVAPARALGTTPRGTHCRNRFSWHLWSRTAGPSMLGCPGGSGGASPRSQQLGPPPWSSFRGPRCCGGRGLPPPSPPLVALPAGQEGKGARPPGVGVS